MSHLPYCQVGAGSSAGLWDGGTRFLSTCASSCTAWGSSQHGAWVPERASQVNWEEAAWLFLTHSQKSHSITSAISCLWEGSQTHADSRGGDLVFMYSWSCCKVNVRRPCGWEILLHPSLENATCHHSSEKKVSPSFFRRVM